MFREGSDYMPFYADLGIPSMDFRYTFDKVRMKHLQLSEIVRNWERIIRVLL